MFLHLSVIHSVHRVFSMMTLPVDPPLPHKDGPPPQGWHPQEPPRDSTPPQDSASP